MFNKKSNLDEMQEQKLLKIEHNGMWLAFFGLFASIIIQIILSMYGERRDITGEFIVFLALAVYIVGACIKHGIWDRRLKPDLKTNVAVSAVTGAICGLIFFSSIFFRFDNALFISVLVGLFALVLTFVITLITLSFFSGLYKKRVDELEKKVDENSDL